MKKLLALSLAVSFGLAMGSMANAQTAGTELDPSYRGTVNVDVIDADNETFRDRVNTELVERPAPQVGQTRAVIEAMYGPSMTALAPNKKYEIYTNEFDLTDGKMFQRELSQDALRIYEVSYRTGAHKSANDTATDVKLRVIPRIGDHKNLVTKMLEVPNNNERHQNGQEAFFKIPKERFVFYNDVISSPFTAVHAYFDADGNMVGQEFLPSRYQGQYALSSAGRYIEIDTKAQPDRKVMW